MVRKKVSLCPEDYRPLVAKKSWKAWRQLPPRSRVWIDVEDLIQSGMIYLQEKVIPTYKKSGSPFLLWATVLLGQFYSNEVSRIRKAHHDDARVTSLEILLENGFEVRSENPSVIALLTAKEALRCIYREASEETKKEIKRWFSGAKSDCRVNRVGLRKATVRSEFRDLSQAVGFTGTDFRLMMDTRLGAAVVRDGDARKRKAAGV